MEFGAPGCNVREWEMGDLTLGSLEMGDLTQYCSFNYFRYIIRSTSFFQVLTWPEPKRCWVQALG